MINFTNITQAIQDILKAANTSSRSYTITRNQVLNTDESVAVQGWIGIYRDNVSYDPLTVGNTPYLTEVVSKIEIQSASYSSPEDCEKRLEEIVEFVLDALKANPTLNGYVHMLKGITVDYDDNYAKTTDIFFQTATVELTSETRS